MHEVAILTHNVFCVVRKFVGKDDLSDEGRKLLFLLSDAAHNLLMTLFALNNLLCADFWLKKTNLHVRCRLMNLEFLFPFKILEQNYGN